MSAPNFPDKPPVHYPDASRHREMLALYLRRGR